jgi:hypothetical protein
LLHETPPEHHSNYHIVEAKAKVAGAMHEGFTLVSRHLAVFPEMHILELPARFDEAI